MGLRVQFPNDEHGRALGRCSKHGGPQTFPSGPRIWDERPFPLQTEDGRILSHRMPTVQDKEPREAQTQEVTSLLNTSKSSDRDAGVQM